MIDLIPQLNRIVKKNISYIQQSWSNLCNWETPTDAFCKSELQLVFNTDGAPIFKSSKLSVWPTWVQIFNLPPVLRSSYSNICLLALWYGESKPDFDDMLQRVCLELESFSNGVLFESIGRVFLRYRSIVCEEVSKPFILREKNTFQACGELAEKRRIAVNGVKSITPLSKFFNSPWDFVIDPMHQVCLGTAKILSKFLISLAKGGTLKELENLVSNCKIPFDILHRTKNLKDLTFWKAFDFKLFFFHIGPLVFDNLNVSNI